MADYKELIPVAGSKKELIITNGDALILGGIIQVAQIVKAVQHLATELVIGTFVQIKVDIEDAGAKVRFIDEYYRVLKEEIIPEIGRAKAYDDAERHIVPDLGLDPKREERLRRRLRQKEDLA